MKEYSTKRFVMDLAILISVLYIIATVVNGHIERRKYRNMIPINTADSIIDLYKTQTYRAIQLCKQYAAMSDSLNKEINKTQKVNHGK